MWDHGAPTIMMVDDEPTTLAVLQVLLEDAGYNRFVMTCESDRAVELAQAEHPDLLLLDLVMPEVGGLEILQAMRDDDKLCHTPVIVLTSSTDSETKLTALELGATDFLAKPVDPSELAVRLRNTLAAKAHRDRLANFDRVTELPNKIHFMKRASYALERAQRDDRRCALVHIDLNRFEQINDALGHDTGDQLLEQVARRLDLCVRVGDEAQDLGERTFDGNLSRLDGTEFVLCLPNLPTLGSASKVARRIVEGFQSPFTIAERKLFVTLSIGISVFPSDGTNIDLLLRHAKVAADHARRNGREEVQYYSKEFNTSSSQQLVLEHDLYKVLENDELVLHYQPKIDARSGALSSAEALMRWHHPEFGVVAPNVFIPIAEETGLIVTMGYWAIIRASNQSVAWESEGLPKLRVAVNVSAIQFRDRNMLEKLHYAVRNGELDPSRVCLEVTESVLIDHLEDAIDTLTKIRSMGFAISLDDFGTGYSSLGHLKRLPIDELKIDRSFVKDAPECSDDVAILGAIVAMAHGLGLSVVAEGVETQEQEDVIRRLGCDYIQGFKTGAPMPASAFTVRFAPEPLEETIREQAGSYRGDKATPIV